MTDLDLKDLRTRIEAAEERQANELSEKGSIPILPLSEWLTDGDWRCLWEIVRQLRREYVEAAIRFPEDALPGLVVDVLSQADPPATKSQLAQALALLADAEGPWLVSTPLANIHLAEPVVEVAPRTVVLRAIAGRAWLSDRSAAADDMTRFKVHEFLGDRIPQVTQWTENSDDLPIDTRVGASLLTVEEGVASLALARARARAQYAIAVWTILSPPNAFELLPDLGAWVPQPNIHREQRFKLKEDGSWNPKARIRGGAESHYSSYTAPPAEILRVPFDAFAHLDQRCAQALLSASLNLAYAMRRSRSELSAQLRNTMACLEVLCEKQGVLHAADARWDAVTARFDVWSELANRGYGATDIEELQRRVRRARNVASHGADAALLDLGYPERAQRQVGKSTYAPGTDFAYPTLAADLVPLRFALGFVIEKLLGVAQNTNWDDATFEAQFS